MYQVVGQSYSTGIGVEAGKGAAQLLAAYLKQEEQNFGVVGAVLYYSKVAGGYATVANKLVRTSATFARGTEYGVVWYGGNDLFCMDATFSAASQAHLKSVFRFAISRMCAGKIYDDEDASIAYSGFSKSSELGEGKVTGKFTHFATANGSKVTISVPSSFPGGTVAVYLNAENGTGGTWTFKVDGASSGELSTKYTYGVTALSMFCKRFTGLAPGAHTIELTVNSITTYAAFDSWAIEAPTPPTVIVPGQFKLNEYGAGETHNPVDADVEALEKLIKEACAEFGSYAKFVSLASMDHTLHVQADKLHPTAQGHEEIFALFKTALEEVGATPAVLALGPAAGSSSTAMALRTPAVLPLAPAEGKAATAMALRSPAALPLGPAEGKAATAMALSTPVRLPLAAAAGSSSTAMALSTPSKAALLPSPAAGSSTTRMELASKPRLALGAANGSSSTAMVLSTPSTAPKIVVVREYVPSRLTVIIRAPDGTLIGRWSQESSIENVFFGLTKDGEMPGGHKEFSCTLARDPNQSYPDLALFSRLELQGAGGERLWSGTIRQEPKDGDRGTIEVKAVGDKQLLEDDEVIGPGFISTDLSRWTGPSVTRRLILENLNRPSQQDPATNWGAGAAALRLEVQGAWAEPTIPVCEAWFDAGSGVGLGEVLGDWANGNADLNFILFVAFCNDEGATATVETSGDYYEATSGHFPQIALQGQRYAFINWQFSATAAGVDGQQFGVDLQNLKVIGTQGLPLQGTWPNVGLTAKQMLPYILDGSGLTTKDELLEDDGFVIPHAWFSDPTTRAANVVEVTKYGLLDWFVFNDRLFQYRIPGTYGRRWRLAPGSARPKSSGPDGQRVWDRYMISWQDVDGTTKFAGPPGSGAPYEDARLITTDPRNAAVAGETPRGKLIALNGKCEVEQAIKTALRVKEEAEQLDQSGEVTISGRVQDADSGAWYPPAYVQPGDWVADPGTSNYRKITAPAYADDQKQAACSIGAPPEGQKAIEERFNARLLELGLGS